MTDIVNKETAEQLKRYVEAIENYEAEKKGISESLKEIYDEARSKGFDVKTIRALIKERKIDKEKLLEQQCLLEVYRDAVQLNLF